MLIIFNNPSSYYRSILTCDNYLTIVGQGTNKTFSINQLTPYLFYATLTVKTANEVL